MAKVKDDRFASVLDFLLALRAAVKNSLPCSAGAVALWVEASPLPEDGALEVADEVLARAERMAVDFGLTVVVDTPDAILASGTGVPAQDLRNAATRIQTDAKKAGLTLRIAVHCAEVHDEIFFMPTAWPAEDHLSSP
jgi:hypothetical protein